MRKNSLLLGSSDQLPAELRTNSAVVMGLVLMTSMKEVCYIQNILIFLLFDKWPIKSYFCYLLMHCYPNQVFLWMFVLFIIIVVSIFHLDYYLETTKVLCQWYRSFFNINQPLKYTKKPEECQQSFQPVEIWNSPGIVPSRWQAAALCSHCLEKFLQTLCQVQ